MTEDTTDCQTPEESTEFLAFGSGWQAQWLKPGLGVEVRLHILITTVSSTGQVMDARVCALMPGQCRDEVFFEVCFLLHRGAHSLWQSEYPQFCYFCHHFSTITVFFGDGSLGLHEGHVEIT